ncbi:MAG: hypothetical protein M1814_003281 [Vezdaea aestivalis]|nr:MAG: hypothetical protein M1814_003281 [Vezdaea aestivalis]
MRSRPRHLAKPPLHALITGTNNDDYPAKQADEQAPPLFFSSSPTKSNSTKPPPIRALYYKTWDLILDFLHINSTNHDNDTTTTTTNTSTLLQLLASPSLALSATAFLSRPLALCAAAVMTAHDPVQVLLPPPLLQDAHPTTSPRPHVRRASWVDKFEHSVPGARTGRAFLTSLSTNIHLSNAVFPPDSPTMSATDGPSPDSPVASNPTSSASIADEIDTRTLRTTTDPSNEQIVSALRLTADSVAQQRQNASRAVISSPLTLAVYTMVLAALYSRLVRSNSDLPLYFTTAAGLTMAALLGVRSYVQGYLDEAEKIGLKWLVEAQDGEDDDTPRAEQKVLVTEFGEETVGALIMAFPPPSPKRKKPRGEDVRVRIRAWTTIRRYRGKGIGKALLEEAVKLARDRFGPDVRVDFDQRWAGYRQLLPGLFLGGFRKREEKAKRALQEVLKKTG